MKLKELLLSSLLIGSLGLVGCQSTQSNEVCEVCHKDNIDNGDDKYINICGVCEGLDESEEEFIDGLNNDKTYQEAINFFNEHDNTLLNFAVAYSIRDNAEEYSKLSTEYNIPSVDIVEKYAKCANKIQNYERFKTVTIGKEYSIDLSKYSEKIDEPNENTQLEKDQEEKEQQTNPVNNCPECGSPRNGVCDNPNCSSNSGLDTCVDCGSEYKMETLEYDSNGNGHCGCVNELEGLPAICPVCGNDNVNTDACDCLVEE